MQQCTEGSNPSPSAKTVMKKTEDNNDRDARLVREALTNTDIFAEIISNYQPALSRYIRRLGCRDDEDVDDVLQEIFLKVYINLNQYNPSLSFSSWIYRITHNETVSYFRQKKVRPALVSSDEAKKFLDNLASDEDIAELINAKINRSYLIHNLSELDEKYRYVLVLKFFEGKTYSEISDILKVPMGTVATLVSRAKKQLEAKLRSNERQK